MSDARFEISMYYYLNTNPPQKILGCNYKGLYNTDEYRVVFVFIDITTE